MDPNTQQRIATLVTSSPVLVFMKGTKLMPQCGFSNNVVQILHALGVSFETFDVLSDPEIRQGIKEFSDWPTIPQVYVKGSRWPWPPEPQARAQRRPLSNRVRRSPSAPTKADGSLIQRSISSSMRRWERGSSTAVRRRACR